VAIEGGGEIRGDRLRITSLDLVAVHEVHDLAVAQERHRRAARLVFSEVLPRSRGRVDVLPRNTVTTCCGFTPCCSANRSAGRALPAAQPQTEFTKTSMVPF